MLRYFRSSYKIFLGDIITGLALVLIAGRLGTLIEQTGWVARVVLCILLILSVFSWAIIFQKSSQFGRIEPQTKKFLKMFRAGRGLPDPSTLRAGAGGTPLVVVYQAGYRELEAQLGGATARGNPSAGGAKMTLPFCCDSALVRSWSGLRDRSAHSTASARGNSLPRGRSGWSVLRCREMDRVSRRR